MLSISEVARQVRLRPSAIRYYEKIGLLPAPERVSGQRRYDTTVLHRLALIQLARQAGFGLDEIRSLFFGFRPGTRAQTRWRKLADRKIGELDALAAEIRTMRALLKTLKVNCHCKTLDVCGRAVFDKGISSAGRQALHVIPKARPLNAVR